MILSIRLKDLRDLNNLTQKELGSLVGLSMQAINDIEHGRRATTAEKLIAIADYFNVSIDYLLGRTDSPEVSQVDSSQNVTTSSSKIILSLDHQELLSLYEQISKDDKLKVKEMVRTFASLSK